MRALIATLLVAGSLSLPATHAEAGFLTEVVKANVKNSVRHAKDRIDRSTPVTVRRGICAVKRAAGRPCD